MGTSANGKAMIFWIKSIDGKPRMFSADANEVPCPLGGCHNGHPDFPCDHPAGYPTEKQAIRAYRKEWRCMADSFEAQAAWFRKRAAQVVRPAPRTEKAR
jgi:hypothetical protein